jgi:SAM-dependent methyltransferase
MAMSGNIERFSGFAEDYNTFRPKPPSALKNILLDLARVAQPALVVDLGSGTGLSTRYWADVAASVIGVEPNADMRAQAISETAEGNVHFRNGTSAETGLADGSADIVTCSQSLHWMEPTATFAEVARILRSGGVFAAYDYEWPPTTGIWRAELAYIECARAIDELEKTAAVSKEIRNWSKNEHLAHMAESGLFRFTKEIVVHHLEDGDADRLVGLLLSQSAVRALLKAGYTGKDLGIDRLRQECRALLGPNPKAWYWSSRVRIGVR